MSGKFDNVAELLAKKCSFVEIDYAFVQSMAQGNKTEAKIFDLARTIKIILEGVKEIKKGK